METKIDFFKGYWKAGSDEASFTISIYTWPRKSLVISCGSSGRTLRALGSFCHVLNFLLIVKGVGLNFLEVLLALELGLFLLLLEAFALLLELLLELVLLA